MRFRNFLISFLVSTLIVSVTQSTSVKFHKYLISNTQYAANRISFKNLDSGEVLVNFSVEFFQDVLKELHSVEIKANANDMDFSYGMTLLKTKLDSCRVAEGVRSSLFVKVFLEHFQSAGNYDFKCPFKAGMNNATNLRITTNFLPPFPRALFPSGRITFRIKDDLHGKVPGQKKLVRLYSWELWGKLFE